MGRNLPAKKRPVKKIVTPFERLWNRILKQFPKKKLIGDIIIKDFEYEILIDYFKGKSKGIINTNTYLKNDPMFATALVQIGIKYYDSNFWGHVQEVLGTKKMSAIHQGLIGQSFVNTLTSNNKIMLDKSERVNNILMHGFVSNNYANEMFDFMFKFYNIDLERDLLRNNSEMMNGLIEVIQRNDNTGRTYLLVKQTSNAITANVRGGKIRIRWILRLIDKCFWEQITPINPVSRLSILFNKWQENSNEFKAQFNKYNGGTTNVGGKKSYSSPYIKCNFQQTTFMLVLPTQLIKFEFERNVKWNIFREDEHRIIETSLYQAVTGYKTEVQELTIKAEDIFSVFSIELTCDDKRIRIFKIKADCIRFFDKDGDYLNSDNSLPSGEVYAFTKQNETPHSEALIENESIGKLVRSYFEFEYGDIVRLPDGRPISIGKRLEEGLLHRKALNASHSMNNNVVMPIYYAPPTILLKIAAKRANGTVIEINSNRHRLFDKETTVIDLGDRSGETGYILNLSDYGYTHDGIYTVAVDVPNDRTDRYWQFVLINGIEYEFEDAPYLFKSKGTIRFNEDLLLHPKGNTAIKNTDENSFNFEINPDVDDLQFSYNIKNKVINLSFDIPVLKWKFDKGLWNVEKSPDIWHSDFPSTIHIKYPQDKIVLSMDEHIVNDNDTDDQTVAYYKSKEKGFFECDITRFKSWFGREKVLRSIFLDFPKNRTEFARIITQSIVVAHILKGNFESEKLIGEIDIVGNANYFVDVVLLETKEKLAEKLLLKDGKFEIKSNLSNGLYQVNVFEDEEDDTGFGVSNYLQIGEFKHNIINPYDLHGKSIAIKHIKKREDSPFQMHSSCRYIISNLKRLDQSDKNNYKGKLIHGSSPVSYDVFVQFIDLNRLQYVYLTYFDGYDYLEFLYDTNRKIIVKAEEKGLTRAVRYRRYESLFPEDYVYVVEFTNDIPKTTDINRLPVITGTGVPEQHDKHVTIGQMGLTVKTYQCLNRAKIQTTKDIEKYNRQMLLKIRNLGNTGVTEIILKMKMLGFPMDETKPVEANLLGLQVNKVRIQAEETFDDKKVPNPKKLNVESNPFDASKKKLQTKVENLRIVKFWTLQKYLRQCRNETETLTFNKIEKLAGDKLPLSAYRYRDWWLQGNHQYADLWLYVGWRVDGVRLGEFVTFKRVKPS